MKCLCLTANSCLRSKLTIGCSSQFVCMYPSQWPQWYVLHFANMSDYA
jgi:hypothetical protein